MPWTHSMLFRASISLFFSEFSGRSEEDRNKPLTRQTGLISQRSISEIITQSRSEFGSNCLRKHTAVINIVQGKQSCQVLFLTETQFTYHKIHPFKVNNFMVFNIVLRVCNYHYYLVPEYFCHPPSLSHKKTPISMSSHSPLFYPQAPGISYTCSQTMCFFVSDVLSSIMFLRSFHVVH